MKDGLESDVRAFRALSPEGLSTDRRLFEAHDGRYAGNAGSIELARERRLEVERFG